MSLAHVCLVAGAMLVWAQGATPGQNTPNPAPGPGSKMTIGPDDTVTITVPNVDEISRAWRVSSSGVVTLPFVGEIQAEGKTPEQLQREIAAKLQNYVRNPQVAVFLSEVRSRPITVSGAVERPGTQQLQANTTLYESVVQAGGAKDAGPTVTLTRKVAFGRIPDARALITQDGAYSVLEVPLQDVMRGFGGAADLSLLPYDVVTVSQDKRSRMVYLVGEVAKPGAIELVTQDVVSLTKALAMAGGLTRTSSPGKTMIRHIGASGTETAVAFVNVKQILSGKARDLLLSDGDIVVVPSNQLKEYLQLASTSAVTAGVWVLGRL